MSGPIVRSGATPEFSKNWDKVFGKKSGGGSTATAKKGTKKSKPAQAPKKKTVKKK